MVLKVHPYWTSYLWIFNRHLIELPTNVRNPKRVPFCNPASGSESYFFFVFKLPQLLTVQIYGSVIEEKPETCIDVF